MTKFSVLHNFVSPTASPGLKNYAKIPIPPSSLTPNNCYSPFPALRPRLLKHHVGIWEPHLKQIVLIKTVISNPERCKLLKSCQEGEALMESSEQLQPSCCREKGWESRASIAHQHQQHPQSPGCSSLFRVESLGCKGRVRNKGINLPSVEQLLKTGTERGAGNVGTGSVSAQLCLSLTGLRKCFGMDQENSQMSSSTCFFSYKNGSYPTPNQIFGGFPGNVNVSQKKK